MVCRQLNFSCNQTNVIRVAGKTCDPVRRPPLVVRRAAVDENGRLAVEHRAQIVRHPPPERVLFASNESLITRSAGQSNGLSENLVLDAEHERGSRHGEHNLLDFDYSSFSIACLGDYVFTSVMEHTAMPVAFQLCFSPACGPRILAIENLGNNFAARNHRFLPGGRVDDHRLVFFHFPLVSFEAHVALAAPIDAARSRTKKRAAL